MAADGVRDPGQKALFRRHIFSDRVWLWTPGLADLIESTINFWNSDRQKLLGSADKITELISDSSLKKVTGKPDEQIMVKAFQLLAGQYDREYGGFGKAPKFPTPHQLMFLLRYWRKSGDQAALAMVRKTLVS